MLTKRAANVLRAVVEQNIKSKGPVAAKAIASQRRFDLSAASIRNVMAHLEEDGYLTKPHTSAGRAPTDSGYRYYVESLMPPMRLSVDELTELKTATHGAKWRELAELLVAASKALASLSTQAAMVGITSSGASPIKSVHFVHIHDNLSLAVVITPGGGIQNRLIPTDEKFSQDNLDKISAYVSDRFSGLSMRKIRKKLFEETLREKTRVDLLAKWALAMASAIDEQSDTEKMIFVDGVPNLLNKQTHGIKLEKIKEILETLEEKRNLVHLLRELLRTEGAGLIIGAESSIDELSDFSIVSHTFTACDETMGAVGIIGPRMMNYSHAVALVSATAREISRRLAG